MRTTIKVSSVVMAVAIAATTAFAMKNVQQDEEMVMTRKKLNGPRLGITYIPTMDWADRDGTLWRSLDEKGMGPVVSQFGWHFEWIVAPESGGPAFVTELLPFVGGVEAGKIIPSTSLVFGIRMPAGFEFGMGPNIMTTFDPDRPVHTSLLLAVGQSLAFGEVQIPLNVAVLTNQDGNRLSLVFGYALPDRKKRVRNAW